MIAIAKEELRVIGKSVPDMDARVKVTGQALYCDDLVMPGMLHGKILRSPHPHARIVRIDVSRAKRARGVRDVVTGADILPRRYNLYFPATSPLVDQYPLAVDKVRYIGDEVAAVAAIDEQAAAEALRLIDVEYEVLPAVFDQEAALSPEAPLIHDGCERNVAFHVHVEEGDVDAAFAEAYHVRSDRFTTQPVAHCPLEPHASLAHFDASGRLLVYNSGQAVFQHRRNLAYLLDMPESKIRVVQPYVGGGFGGKHPLFPFTYCAALLSRRTGRPVKITLSREETFNTTRIRHPFIIDLKTGVSRDGRILAKDVRVLVDNGGYCGHGPLVTARSGFQLSLVYRIPTLRFDGKLVYTNTSPGGAFRGVGHLQARYADDCQMTMIAEDLGLDPAEVMLKNAVQANSVTLHGAKVVSCGLSESIRRATEAAGWHEKKGKLPPGKGIGIGLGSYLSGSKSLLEGTAATVRMEVDGTATLLTGASDIGQGSRTSLAQIAAEALRLPIDRFQVISADTDVTPQNEGTFSSRVTLWDGNAVRAAALDARRQLCEIVSQRLEVSVEDLEVEDGIISVKGAPGRGMSYQEAIQSALRSQQGPVVGQGFYNPQKPAKSDIYSGKGDPSPTYSFGAFVAEVEVDPNTGLVRVTNVTAAYDCGRVVNRMGMEGQIEGSVLMGIGQGITETMARKGGLNLNPSLLDYGAPRAPEMPRINTILVETVDPEGPFGAKGASEGCLLPMAPALANAIADAVGIRFTDLPVSPEKICLALRRDRGRFTGEEQGG